MKLTLPLDPADTFYVGSSDAPVVTPESEVSVHSQYLLVCQAHSTSLTDGHWRFVLETSDGDPVFEADDQEFGDLNRLTLLAAVRGLESIEGPSAVTLLSNNRYLIKSLSDSLPRWRQNDFIWEHFGRRIDVQNADLWRRIDRALSIHRVEACLVSSRLVSTGDVEPSSDRAGGSVGSVDRRIDPANRRSAVPAPKMNRRRSSLPKPGTSAQSHGDPIDPLRRWLLASSGAATTPPRGRFTAADLERETER